MEVSEERMWRGRVGGGVAVVVWLRMGNAGEGGPVLGRDQRL